MKFLKPLVFLLLLVFMTAGCSSENEKVSSSNQSKSDLAVYTTVYPLQYIVEEIGGNTVTTDSVYPPGADGHTYEPTSKEMTEFAKSDAFIYIGEGMEGFSESVSSALKSQDVSLIEIGKHKELFHHEHADHHHDHDDDHDEHDHNGDVHDHGQDGGDHDQDGHNHEHDEDDHEVDEEQAISIKGLADHYHTGDTIELTAKHNGDATDGHWHWFTRDTDSGEWKKADNQNEDTFEGEATTSEQQIKAEIYDDNHELVAESNPVTITIDDHEDHDPHIWTDPLRVIKVAEIVKEELIELNPSEESLYNENYDALKNKLTDLDERYMEILDAKENKHILVPHAAFGYWEERYGIVQIPISGLSSGEEPSQKALTEVIKAAEKYNVDYVLYEQNSKNRLAEIIQEQVDADAVMIHNLEVRTEKDIEDGKDYIELMDDNLKVLDKITK